MKKVVSYAFFRSEHSEYESERCGEARGRFFVNYFRAIVPAHQSVMPDWEMRIHYDDQVTAMPYWRALCRMETAGLLKLVPCGEAKTFFGSMLWRLKPIWDEGVDVVSCRDVDSLPTPRDKKAVENWLTLNNRMDSRINSPETWMFSMQDSPR